MLILKEEWQSHPKILNAVYQAGSPAVKHLWFDLISSSANGGGDGIIEPFEVAEGAVSCGLDMETTSRFMTALLNSGTRAKPAPLFHDAESLAKCPPCKEALRKAGHSPGPSDIVVHDFFAHNPAAKDKTPMGRAREARKNWLKRGNGTKLKDQIYARDQGLCRYCGIRPIEGGTGKTALWWDHRDPNPMLPNNGNFLENVCVACAGCNNHKNQRTPEEAGMRILGAGITALDVQQGHAVYVDSFAELGARPEDQETRSPDDAPPAGVGPGSAPGRHRVGAGEAPGRERGGAGATQPTPRSPKSGGKSRSKRTTPPRERAP